MTRQQLIAEIHRRLARETGAVIKDWGGKLPVALIYPNSYRVGMSNLGVQAIYRFINDRQDAVCERVFIDPAQDEPPLAMESQRPLTDFAVLAFSVSYELDYFNVVRALRLAGLPLYARDRTEEHPLVIGGGPCLTANPAPLAPFFDCVCIGEAEAILPRLLPVLQQHAGEPRDGLLEQLAAVPGVYVPARRSARALRHAGVERQWLADLDSFPVHSTVLTRDTELGGMYLIEVQRGCHRGCRFCLVSTAFRPMRCRSLECIFEQAREGLKHRKRLGLVGPAVTDHPQIEELVQRLGEMGARISVSSLRIKPLPPGVLGEVIGGGTQTVALAPEAGSQRLRNHIRKGITEADILEAVEKVAAQKVRQLKLYFMIGLPTETDADIEEMAGLVKACKSVLDANLTGGRITVTIAPFVPKAGTPFERQGMAPLDVLQHRLSLLKGRLPSKGVSVKNESLEWSEVQAVFSRGGTPVAEALARVEKAGLAEWRWAVEEAGLDTDFYAHGTWDDKQGSPWGVVDTSGEED